MEMFKLHSNYEPKGDQPKAIAELTEGILENEKHQTLLGITGSGKTFTIANVIQNVQKPTLVIAHNKTLAAQLYSEFREFFPENAVEYFVSYYDYYQPEAYLPSTDTYIEKDASINDEIDKLRHSATMALFERRDVIIVSSVSCIYGLGDPEDYSGMVISLRPGMKYERDIIIAKLIELQYQRNEIDFKRGTFRVRGDVLEIFPIGQNDKALRVQFWGDEIEKISEIEVVTGKVLAILKHARVFPASHYVTARDKMLKAIDDIEVELEQRVAEFKSQGKLIEAQRILQRTNYDIEMMKETGTCQGIENYSRVMSGRKPGSAPYTLIDYFPKDFLLVVDESHVTVPQIGAMYNGDRARKNSLVEYGFRLPSAYDNRPLTFKEFEQRVNQAIYVSATPAEYERSRSKIVEQVIRPTGLLDPEVEVRPIEGQIDHLIGEINKRAEKDERVLVTTLTKRMAEDLTEYLKSAGIRVQYLHSDIAALERVEIINGLRKGEFDVLIGINLLREGLDIPEVSLVAILDADKQGFLRSETSLIQTIGRASRNYEGKVIMYADELTESMEKAITETNRRRKIQMEFNEKHGIVPKTIKKDIRDNLRVSITADEDGQESNVNQAQELDELEEFLAMNESKQKEYINKLEKEMIKAAQELEFEKAAELRDRIKKLGLG